MTKSLATVNGGGSPEPSTSTSSSHRDDYLISLGQMALLGILSFALLTASLAQKSFWIDELHSLAMAHLDIPSVIQQVATDLHPPLYFVLLNLWTKVAGDSEFALRYLSVLAAVFAVFAVYALGRKLLDSRLGLIASLLVAIAPFFVLYGRMARYYSLTLALGLLSTLLFFSFLDKRKPAALIGYIVASTLLIYTDYPAASVLIAHNILLIETVFSGRKSEETGFGRLELVKSWLVVDIAILLLYAPWLGILLRSAQAASEGAAADFAQGLAGYALKIAFPFYSFAVGETILPWRVPAGLAILATILLFVVGIRFLLRESRASAIRVIVLLTIPLAATISIISLAAPSTTFLNVPSRTMFAFPFFSLLVAAGILYNKDRRMMIVALLLIVLSDSFALQNYLSRTDFLNPIYAVPTREIVREVAADSQPDDVYLSEIDTGFEHYYLQASLRQKHFLTSSPEAKLLLERGEAKRVWLITLGRDASRMHELTPREIIQNINSDYSLAAQRGYVEQDQWYQRLKEALLHRPAYQHKVLVELYVRK